MNNGTFLILVHIKTKVHCERFHAGLQHGFLLLFDWMYDHAPAPSQFLQTGCFTFKQLSFDCHCIESMRYLFRVTCLHLCSQIKIYDGFSLAFCFAVRAPLHYLSPFFSPYLNAYLFPLETQSSADQPITQLTMFVCG